MELSEAVRRRRMVRSFSGRPPAGPALEEILASALRAPSAGNSGGLDLVVLEEPADREAFWEATTTGDWRARSRRWPGLSRAPVIIVLLADAAAYLTRYGKEDKAGSGLGSVEAWPVPYWFVDGGMAALLLLLGAVPAGLGACFLGNFRGEEALLQVLGVPEGRRYLGAVLLGEPGVDASDPPSPSLRRGGRRAVEVVHRGRW